MQDVKPNTRFASSSSSFTRGICTYNSEDYLTKANDEYDNEDFDASNDGTMMMRHFVRSNSHRCISRIQQSTSPCLITKSRCSMRMNLIK